MKHYLLPLIILVTTHACMSGLKDIILRKQVLYHVVVKTCETEVSKTLTKFSTLYGQGAISCDTSTWEQAIKFAYNNLSIEYPEYKVDKKTFEDSFFLIHNNEWQFEKTFSQENKKLIIKAIITKK